MIFSSSQKSDVDSYLGAMQKGLWIASALCSLLGLWLYVVPKSNESCAFEEGSCYAEQEIVGFLDDIARGPFALNACSASCLLPDLTRELIILARSSKPCMQPSKNAVLVSTRGSTQPKVIYSGEQVFLEEVKKGDGEVAYSFTENKAPLWIRPFVLAGEDVSVEIGMFSSSKENENFLEEVSEVIIPQVRSSKEGGRGEGKYMTTMRGALFWGTDLFLKNYGGREYREMSLRGKLEVPSETGVDVYFVSPGDYLQWSSGSWQQISAEQINEEAPIALIKEVTPKELELEVWDDKGFYPQKVRLPQQVGAPHGKMELSSSLLKLKTTTQVSCTLGRRRFVLKEGDWLLKVGRTWRTLSRSRDIDDYLSHKMRGELFVFDALERQAGKTFVKGVLFDEMRTQMIPLSLSVEVETAAKEKDKKTKTSGAATRKKRAA